jgi:hypothetical protein
MARVPDMTQIPTFDPTLAINPSGRVAYHRYLDAVESRHLGQVGARFLIAGTCELTMIGYGDLQVHRTAGLKRALTLALGPDAFARIAP